MKYICMGVMNREAWDARSDTEKQQFMDACFAYDDELRAGGHFVGGEALQDASAAVTLRWDTDRVTVTDGPFAETKEQIGGIMVLEANDLNHAIRLLSKHPSLPLGKGAGSWEIRPAADLSVFLEASRARRNL